MAAENRPRARSVKRGSGLSADVEGEDTTSLTAKNGVLKKRSQRGVWQRRFFQLNNAFLNYYSKSGASALKGTVELRRVADVELSNRFGDFRLQLQPPGGSFELRAKDVAAAGEWVRCLRERLEWLRANPAAFPLPAGDGADGDAPDSPPKPRSGLGADLGDAEWRRRIEEDLETTFLGVGEGDLDHTVEACRSVLAALRRLVARIESTPERPESVVAVLTPHLHCYTLRMETELLRVIAPAGVELAPPTLLGAIEVVYHYDRLVGQLTDSFGLADAVPPFTLAEELPRLFTAYVELPQVRDLAMRIIDAHLAVGSPDPAAVMQARVAHGEDGRVFTSTPVDLMEMLVEAVDVVARAGVPPLVVRAAAAALGVVRESWARVTADLAQQTEHREVDYICSFVNDSEALLDRIDELLAPHPKAREALADKLEGASKALMGGIGVALSALADLVFADLEPSFGDLFSPRWYESDVTAVIVVTVADYADDYRSALSEYFFSKLMLDVATRLVFRYVHQLVLFAQHRARHRLQPAGVHRLSEDTAKVRELFRSQLAHMSTTVDARLTVMDEACELLELEPDAARFAERFSHICQHHPGCSAAVYLTLECVVGVRPELSARQRKAVLDACRAVVAELELGEEDGGAPDDVYTRLFPRAQLTLARRRGPAESPVKAVFSKMRSASQRALEGLSPARSPAPAATPEPPRVSEVIAAEAAAGLVFEPAITVERSWSMRYDLDLPECEGWLSVPVEGRWAKRWFRCHDDGEERRLSFHEAPEAPAAKDFAIASFERVVFEVFPEKVRRLWPGQYELDPRMGAEEQAEAIAGCERDALRPAGAAPQRHMFVIELRNGHSVRLQAESVRELVRWVSSINQWRSAHGNSDTDSSSESSGDDSGFEFEPYPVAADGMRPDGVTAADVDLLSSKEMPAPCCVLS